MYEASVTVADSSCHVMDKDINAMYSGECVDGFAHGYGSATGRDSYVGYFRYGKPNGAGIYRWFNGSEFRGEFRDGKPHGRGIHLYGPNSPVAYARYEGEFLDGQMEGIGVFTWPNGWRFEGQFGRNLADGPGTLFSPDGRQYRGHFLKGRPLSPLVPSCETLPTIIQC